MHLDKVLVLAQAKLQHGEEEHVWSGGVHYHHIPPNCYSYAGPIMTNVWPSCPQGQLVD